MEERILSQLLGEDRGTFRSVKRSLCNGTLILHRENAPCDAPSLFLRIKSALPPKGFSCGAELYNFALVRAELPAKLGGVLANSQLPGRNSHTSAHDGRLTLTLYFCVKKY